MIKYQTIATYCPGGCNDHDFKVKSFIEGISEKGYTFISVNSIAYGEHRNRIRTEIIYRENQTRKVIVEKTD
jgi:hypothetical protein